MNGRPLASGAVWTVAGFATSQILRFAFNLALARLVSPNVFGVMALVNLLIQGLQMFSDMGIRQCVIQHPRGGESKFLNTAWTVQVVRGALLWLGSWLMAWPMAALYGEPALLWLIPLTGFAAFINGFSSTAMLTYGRDMKRGPLVVREIGVYAVSIVVVLAAVAWIHDNMTGSQAHRLELGAMACGAVITAVGGVMLSFTLQSAAPHRFAWEPEAGRSLFRFGGWVFVSSTLTFLAAQADRLVVGKMSLDVLGVYHIANVIVGMPVGIVAALGMHLVFPQLSRSIHGGKPLAEAFPTVHRGLAVAAGLLMTGAACIGPAFIRVVYDDRYQAAAEFVRLLAIAGWLTALLTAGEMALLALGKTPALAVAQGVRLIFLPLCMYVGYAADGLTGFIIGVAVAEAVRYVVVAIYLGKFGLRAFPEDITITAAAALVVGLYLEAETMSGSDGRVVVPLVGVIAITCFWAVVYYAWVGPDSWPRPIRRLRTSIRTSLWGVQP